MTLFIPICRPAKDASLSYWTSGSSEMLLLSAKAEAQLGHCVWANGQRVFNCRGCIRLFPYDESVQLSTHAKSGTRTNPTYSVYHDLVRSTVLSRCSSTAYLNQYLVSDPMHVSSPFIYSNSNFQSNSCGWVLGCDGTEWMIRGSN